MPFFSGNPFSQQGGNPFMQSPYMFNPMMNPGGMAGGSSDFFSGLFNSLGPQGGADPSVAPFWFDFFMNTMWPAQQEALKNQGQNPMLDFFQNDWWPWWKEQQGQEPAALKWPYAGPVGGLAGGDLGYYFNPNDNQFYFQDGTSSGMIWNPQDKRIYYGKDYKNPSLYGYDPTIDQISMFGFLCFFSSGHSQNAFCSTIIAKQEIYHSYNDCQNYPKIGITPINPHH